MKKTVFLGGTCNNSTWRNVLINLLKTDYFNPVVEKWTSECQVEEIKQRKNCDFCLYVITPEMTGVYSIAEVVDDSNKRPEKTVFVYLDGFNGLPFIPHTLKSLKATAKMVADNGAKVFTTLEEAADFLNNN